MPYVSDPRGLYHVFYQCNLNSTLPPWAPGQEGTRLFCAPINKMNWLRLYTPATAAKQHQLHNYMWQDIFYNCYASTEPLIDGIVLN